MARLLVLILIILLIVAGLYFVSGRVHQQPTHVIEVPVSQGGNAH